MVIQDSKKPCEIKIAHRVFVYYTVNHIIIPYSAASLIKTHALGIEYLFIGGCHTFIQLVPHFIHNLRIGNKRTD